MSKLLTRLSNQLRSRGVKNSKGVAVSLLKKRGQMSSNGDLTAKGKKRQAIGAAGRAKDRAAKKSGGKLKDYKYNKRTNRATKK